MYSAASARVSSLELGCRRGERQRRQRWQGWGSGDMRLRPLRALCCSHARADLAEDDDGGSAHRERQLDADGRDGIAVREEGGGEDEADQRCRDMVTSLKKKLEEYEAKHKQELDSLSSMQDPNHVFAANRQNQLERVLNKPLQ